MTDEELVKMARLAQRDDRMATGALYGDLADRIEALTAERDEHWKSFVHWRKEADALTEQLEAREPWCRLPSQIGVNAKNTMHSASEARGLASTPRRRCEEVEALTFYTCAENGCDNCPEQDRGRASCGWTARTTLAEIEGRK